MKRLASWLLIIAGWGAWPAAAGPPAPACEGRALTGPDGGPSGLSDCELGALLDQARLREHLADCVQEAELQTERVYGSLHFELELHPGGGVAALRLPRSAFDRTPLPACIKHVLLRKLAGPAQGAPAALQGRLRLDPVRRGEFGLELAGTLSPPLRRPPLPLPGTFEDRAEGALTSCGLGRARLFLRLDPTTGQGSVRWPQPDPPVAVAACLALAEPNGDKGLPARRPRPSPRALRRQVSQCLIGLLAAPGWEERAAAAEELAADFHWLGRRPLQRAVEQALADPACARRTGARNGANRKNGATDGLGPVPAEDCGFSLPADARAGHALVRMLKAQLRLGRRPKPGLVAALSRHPDAGVRMRLVDTILARALENAPEGLAGLVRDPDPLVRARAQQVGCLRDDWESLRAFGQDLCDPDERVRAQVLIHARACVSSSAARVVARARAEPNPVLVLLLLRGVPLTDPELVLERAGRGLFDPCPLVRFLAVRLLARLAEVPAGLVRQALERESDPRIRLELTALAGANQKALARRVEQLWLQADLDPGPGKGYTDPG